MIKRKRGTSRRERRVLLALLSGASSLSGYPLSRAAQVGSGTVYVVLARLERAGLVDADWETRADNKSRRRFYRLTSEGRTYALEALGLKDGSEADQ